MRERQGSLQFKTHGGPRKGAGRKRVKRRRCVAHRRREEFKARHPLHVTVRLCEGLPSLRKKRAFAVVRGALEAGCLRFGMRLVEWSVQSNHLHLICEAEGAESLTRGMKGLGVRIARRLNRLWERRGKVIEDRFHSRVLRTPREVRSALVYVLQNVKKHGWRGLRGVDPFSTGVGFGGWKRRIAGAEGARRVPFTARPRSWLLSRGWKGLGLIGFEERPVRVRAR